MHPGSKPKSDALPLFFPRTAPEHAPPFSPSTAPEHAAYEWRTAGASGVFTAARAVPQIDRLGKEEIWQTIQSLIAQGLIANEPPSRTERTLAPWVDITDGNLLCWWLWICNLGPNTRKVIGTGVRSAHIAMPTNDEAVFKFGRADDSECLVRLRCTNRNLKVHV